MKFVTEVDLINIFNLLNQSGLNYLLLRNINNELPSNLKTGKDIDILIKKEDESKFVEFFLENNYKTIKHPLKYDVFLYGANRFEFKYNINNNILFDLNFQVVVRSLDAGQWVPLDQIIQESAWKNKRFEQQIADFGYWTLSYDDEFISLLARSIFNKREFQKGYKKRITELFKLINKEVVVKKLNMVFFKYTPCLMEMIEKQKFDEIITNYFKFKEY